jgi:glycosyltransferase involved in cell wall biosynthesis
MRYRIGINGLLISPRRVGGAETYARELVARLPLEDRGLDFTLFAPTDCDLVDCERLEIVRCKVPLGNHFTRVGWEQAIFPRLLRKHGLHLAHFLGSTAPYWYRQKSLVTIHDTLRFQAPASTPPVLGTYYSWIQKRIVRLGHHVISVSNADAAVMCQHLRLPRERVHVVPLGVNDRFFAREGPAAASKDYLLWVGRYYPHKNLDTLLQAYALLVQRRRDVPQLKLIGLSTQEKANLSSQLERLKLSTTVSLAEKVPHHELPQIYQDALLLILPSLCESFGLPVLEAMASGTAVVCSDLPAFRELFAGGVEFVDPQSAEAVAAGVERMLDQPALRAVREVNGIEIAKPFTWSACAQKTLQIYEQLAKAD